MPNRPQKPKGMGNEKMAKAMAGKRSSNAAGPHRLKTAYRRKPKYGRNYNEAE